MTVGSLDTPYEQDTEAQRFVEEHPEGATLDEVATALGVSHNLIHKIEQKALAEFQKRLRLVGVSEADVVEHFARKAAQRNWREERVDDRSDLETGLGALPAEVKSNEWHVSRLELGL